MGFQLEQFSLTGEVQAAPDGGPRTLDLGHQDGGQGRGSDHSLDLWRPEASQEVGLGWGGDLEFSWAPCAVTMIPLSPGLCLQRGNALTKWRPVTFRCQVKGHFPGELTSWLTGQSNPSHCRRRQCLQSLLGKFYSWVIFD